MNRIYSLLLAAALVPATSMAQRGGYNSDPYQYRYENMQYDNSVLSIFSENGEPFLLILNGMKQNLVPQTKIRVESLPKYQNDVQIIFTDGTPPLRKMVNIADPIDGRAVNLTLRISRGRGGARLKFHRMTECDRNYHGPRDEYVMYYGKPQQVNTVTETTYMDPVTGQWITETTTTTTDNYSYNNQYTTRDRDNRDYQNRDSDRDRYTPQPAGPVAMDARTFADAKQSINGSSFDDTKLSTAKTILSSNFVTTDQVIEICNLFSFESNKITFAKFAYGRVVDPQNYYRVGQVFSFDSNKKALNDFISRGDR